jgi:hypothetical protein
MARTAEKKGKASRWTVVVSLTFVVALAVASLVLWLSRPGRSPQPPQQVPGGEATSPGLLAHLAEAPTARQLYPAAAKVAQSWQPDARVAAVSAHWRPERGRWSADVTWTFQFYSPVTRRVAVIIVEGGRAQLLRESVAPYRLAILDEADWQVDSDAALDAWWRAEMAIGWRGRLPASLVIK